MNTNENQIERKSQGKLEQLPPEKQSWLVEIATHSTLINMVQTLKEHGIETSTSALSRFVRKHREEALLEAGEDMKAGVEALAERGKDGKLREGTLEAVRQRLYERALVSNSPEEAREMYAALVKEEARLKELELEARKVAALEQQVKLQGVRIQVMAQQGAMGGKGRVKAEAVVESTPAASGAEVARLQPGGPVAGGELANVGEGGLAARAGLAVGAGRAGGPGEELLAAALEREKRLRSVVGKSLEILNRGGDLGERILEARAVLAEEAREMQT
jgi:hypothetical protein